MAPANYRFRSRVIDALERFGSHRSVSKTPRVVLVYGPSSCGVTSFARYAADEIDECAPGKALVVGLDVCDDLATAGAVFDENRRAGRFVVAVSHSPWLIPRSFCDSEFDAAVFVAPPDVEARRFRIWEYLTRSGVDVTKIHPDVVELVADATAGSTGVDLARLVSNNLEVLKRSGSDLHLNPTEGASWLKSAAAMVASPHNAQLFDDLESYLDRFRLR